jgi:hypothetical protein
MAEKTQNTVGRSTQKKDEMTLETIRKEVLRCYQASNTFTDEDREHLLAGARKLENSNASVVCRPRH